MGDTEKTVSFTVKVKDAASAALKDIEKAGAGVTEKLFGFKDILKDLTAAAAAFSLGAIVKDMIDLGVESDKTFRQIAANLPTFTEGLAELKDGIEQIANASGRNIQAMEQSAAAIAKMGVASADELKQQLEAATMLADATGNDVTSMGQLLIQLRREFHLTGEQALETAAKLAAAAQGKTDVGELFSAFQSSAPIFQKFHIDVETATEAIVALVAAGHGGRQLRKDLNDLDASSIREWAKQATIAADAMDRLTKRANETRQSADANIERMKNSWKEALANVGHSFLDLADKVGVAYTAVDRFVHRSMQNAGMGDVFTGHGSTRTFGGKDDTGDTGFTPPLGNADKAKLEAAAKALAEVRLEAQKLGETSEAATPKSVQFAHAIAEWEAKAKAAKVPQAELTATLARFRTELAAMQRVEVFEQMAKDAKNAKEAFDALAQALAEVSGDALTQFDQKWSKLQDDLAAKRAAIPSFDTAALADFDNQLDRLTQQYRQLRVAVADAAGEQHRLVAIQDEMARGAMTIQQISDRIGELANKEGELRQKIQAATDPATAAEYRKELQEIQAIVEALYGNWQDIGGEVDKQKHSFADLIQQWDGVARAVTSALHAVGILNDKTANAVNAGVNVAQGIGNIASGNVLSGSAEVISGAADLAKSLFGLGQSASQAADALRKMHDGQDSVASTLASWRAQITGTAQDQKAAALLQLRVQYEQIVQTIESTEAGRKQEDQRNRDLAEAAKLYGEDSTALENNTAAMLTNTGILNAVQGYKLNLQLFNFSPAYGPPSGAPSGAPAPGPGGSSGGGSPGGADSGGGTTADRGDQTIYVVLDGKIVATSVVKNLRKMSQAQYGTSSRWNEVVTP